MSNKNDPKAVALSRKDEDYGKKGSIKAGETVQMEVDGKKIECHGGSDHTVVGKKSKVDGNFKGGTGRTCHFVP